MAPILGLDGKPLAARLVRVRGRSPRTAASPTWASSGSHQIVRFDFARGGLTARGAPLALPPAVKTLPSNGSLEALEFVPKGLPLAGADRDPERGYDQNGDIEGFLIGGPSPGLRGEAHRRLQRQRLCARRKRAVHPRAPLFDQARRGDAHPPYSARRHPARRTARRPVIFADLGYEIDNMEGLSVHRGANGDHDPHADFRRQFLADPAAVRCKFALVDE